MLNSEPGLRPSAWKSGVLNTGKDESLGVNKDSGVGGFENEMGSLEMALSLSLDLQENNSASKTLVVEAKVKAACSDKAVAVAIG